MSVPGFEPVEKNIKNSSFIGIPCKYYVLAYLNRYEYFNLCVIIPPFKHLCNTKMQHKSVTKPDLITIKGRFVGLYETYPLFQNSLV